MRGTLSRSMLSSLDMDDDILSQVLSDGNIFRHLFDFLFDRDPAHTFICFGQMGAVLMGAAAQVGINSIIWTPDWMDPSSSIFRVDQKARRIIAIMDRLTDDGPYLPQCWDDISMMVGLTPTSVSEIRCVIDDRTSHLIEATKLVSVSAAIRRGDVS